MLTRTVLAAALAAGLAIAVPGRGAIAQTPPAQDTAKKPTAAETRAAKAAEKKAKAAEKKAKATEKKASAKANRKAAQDRQKQCGAEWKKARADGKVEKGMSWPKYWSACSKRLKEKTA